MTVSNYDYEKFTLEKLESWSEKDLSQFLFLDYFNMSKEMGYEDAREVIFNVLQRSIIKYNRYKFILYFLDKFILKFFKNMQSIFPSLVRGKRSSSFSSHSLGNKTEHRKKILFRPFKYSNIILGVKKYHQAGLLVHGNWDRLFAAKNFIGYIATDDLDHYILAYSKEKDITYLYRLIEEIDNKLKIAKPDYIVLWNDIIPMERAIALASKKLGITTLEIQHGIYDSSLPLGTGKAVDYVLVWGEYFKNIYVKQGKRKPEDIYVLGYPYVIKKNQEIKKKYVVCYLGQDLEICNKDFLSIKLETANNIYNICKKLDLEFIYRPHPGDDRELLKKKLLDIQFTDIKEGLEETFKRADIFISFNSTSLVEAAMRQKISLQLMNYPLISDNFEKLGGCHKSLKTLDELENYLKKIVGAENLDAFKVDFNHDYVETRYNPTERFLEILEEIEKRKK